MIFPPFSFIFNQIIYHMSESLDYESGITLCVFDTASEESFHHAYLVAGECKHPVLIGNNKDGECSFKGDTNPFPYFEVSSRETDEIKRRIVPRGKCERFRPNPSSPVGIDVSLTGDAADAIRSVLEEDFVSLDSIEIGNLVIRITPTGRYQFICSSTDNPNTIMVQSHDSSDKEPIIVDIRTRCSKETFVDMFVKECADHASSRSKPAPASTQAPTPAEKGCEVC